jgi:carbon starvation protein
VRSVLFPLFGIANQLLAAVALTVAHNHPDQVGPAALGVGDRRPLAWDAAVTLTASWYKIFSSDPLIGFFASLKRSGRGVPAFGRRGVCRGS